MLNKIKQFFTNFISIYIFLLCIVGSILIAPAGVGAEIPLMITLGFMSLIGLLMIRPGSDPLYFGKSPYKPYRLNRVKRFNKIVFLFMFLTSISLGFHLHSLEDNYTDFKGDYQIEQSFDMYLFKSDGYKTLYCDEGDIKQDSLNPIKVYKSYRTDLFGFKYSESIEVKSDLMDDYVNLKVIR